MLVTTSDAEQSRYNASQVVTDLLLHLLALKGDRLQYSIDSAGSKQ